MKKFIALFILIFVVGVGIIFIPNALERGNKKQITKAKEVKAKQNNIIQENSSTVDTIENLEIDTEERESELYSENQIYFENMEDIYEYITVNQMDQIKESLQFYVHENINADIKKCKMIKDSILQGKNKLIFQLEVENVKSLKVETDFSEDGTIESVNIEHVM